LLNSNDIIINYYLTIWLGIIVIFYALIGTNSRGVYWNHDVFLISRKLLFIQHSCFIIMI